MPEERANIILRFSLRKQKSGIKRGEQYTVLLVSYFIFYVHKLHGAIGLVELCTIIILMKIKIKHFHLFLTLWEY